MQLGIVNRFNKIKGYGFITPDLPGKEIFVHFSEIQSQGFKELNEGQRVSYLLECGPKGECAKQVSVIESKEDR